MDEYFRLFGKIDDGPFIFVREFYDWGDINNQLNSLQDKYTAGYIDYFNQKTFQSKTIGYIEFDLGNERKLKK